MVYGVTCCSLKCEYINTNVPQHMHLENTCAASGKHQPTRALVDVRGLSSWSIVTVGRVSLIPNCKCFCQYSWNDQVSYIIQLAYSRSAKILEGIMWSHCQNKSIKRIFYVCLQWQWLLANFIIPRRQQALRSQLCASLFSVPIPI